MPVDSQHVAVPMIYPLTEGGMEEDVRVPEPEWCDGPEYRAASGSKPSSGVSGDGPGQSGAADPRRAGDVESSRRRLVASADVASGALRGRCEEEESSQVEAAVTSGWIGCPQ